MSQQPPASAPRAGVSRQPFGTTAAGEPVDVFTLANAAGMEVRFMSRGGIILSVRVPDRDGAFDDVTLGYDALADYEGEPRYFGALVGRYANRIARGRFTMDGAEHALATNNGVNHLHGGPGGFHTRVWRAEPFVDGRGAGAVLEYESADGEEGYPGRLRARVTYALTAGNALCIDYHATATAPTPVNLTQHAYFNLAGHAAGTVLDHELTLGASRFTPVDETLIPTGELRDVRGTPFDFTAPRRIGDRIDADDEQLGVGQGYDHNFVLDGAPADAAPDPRGASFAARLHDPASGRVMEVFTTEPGIQFYSGNVLAGGPLGKGGREYGRRDGLALETQHFPDSPNQPRFPSTVLRPGAELASRTVYRFSTR